MRRPAVVLLLALAALASCARRVVPPLPQGEDYLFPSPAPRELSAAEAKALGCSADIERCRTIVSAGTSADAQLAVFAEHKERSGEAAALQAVSDWIAEATLR